mgnify:CR=1 FL=1
MNLVPVAYKSIRLTVVELSSLSIMNTKSVYIKN